MHIYIYTFGCSGIGCWGDSFNYMVMVKAFQIKPYQEHNQNETACMKYSEMMQLIKTFEFRSHDTVYNNKSRYINTL